MEVDSIDSVTEKAAQVKHLEVYLKMIKMIPTLLKKYLILIMRF